MAKIMIVDDSPDIVWVFSNLLKKAGYTTISASSGEEALEILQTEKPDLMLLDIMMPGMDGWDVAKKIKEDEKTRDMIVIMVSVKSDEKDIKKSMEYSHADGHVDKLRSAGIVDEVAKLLKEKATGPYEIF